MRPALLALAAVAALLLAPAAHAQDYRVVYGTASAAVRSVLGWTESIEATITLHYFWTDDLGTEHYIPGEARISWRASGQTPDGCAVTGSASLTESDPYAVDLEIHADASYRGSSVAYELASDPERITVSCPDQEPYRLPAGLLEFFHIPTGPERGGEPFRYEEVLGVRLMAGAWGSGEPGDPAFTWRLTAEPPTTPAEPAAPAAPLALRVAPNPVQGDADVRLDLPAAAPVRVAVYDQLGREAAVLADGPLPAGATALRFDAGALPPGVYVVRASGPGTNAAVRVTVAR